MSQPKIPSASKRASGSSSPPPAVPPTTPIATTRSVSTAPTPRLPGSPGSVEFAARLQMAQEQAHKHARHFRRLNKSESWSAQERRQQYDVWVIAILTTSVPRT
jgi:hypothetical protein